MKPNPCERIDGTLEERDLPGTGPGHAADDRQSPPASVHENPWRSRRAANVDDDTSSAEARPLFGSGLGRPSTALEAEC